MKLARMNWMQVEEYLRSDDRVVLPLGSTEQHAYLSLATDAILAERVAVEAAEPLGVPVYPVVPYGLAPYFMGFPGTVTLRPHTYSELIQDLLSSMIESGFRRILIVNGHGGNSPVGEVVGRWADGRPGLQVLFHDWWKAPKTMTKVRSTDPDASHASWMENFPWTRLEGLEVPEEKKTMVDVSGRDSMSPTAFRKQLGDGSFGGYYQRDDTEMMQIWAEGVQETRALLEYGWAPEEQ